MPHTEPSAAPAFKHPSLAAALVAASGEMTDPHKSAENPHFRSKYADLGAVLAVVRPVFARHGLALRSGTEVLDSLATVVFVEILHESGQKDRSTVLVPPKVAENPQQLGSFVSYMRRYLTQAAANITGDDDDGNAAQAAVAMARTQAPKATAKGPSNAELKAALTAADTLEAVRALRPAIMTCSDASLRDAYRARFADLDSRKVA